MSFSAMTRSLPVFLTVGGRLERAAVPVQARRPDGGLLARYGAWLQRLDAAQGLREMDPHLARDIGVLAGCERPPEGFAADPRPLWGIGLTPQPMDTLPPWPAAPRKV